MQRPNGCAANIGIDPPPPPPPVMAGFHRTGCWRFRCARYEEIRVLRWEGRGS